MAKINIAVLRGGPSDEYDISLKTGAEIISTLSSDIYNVTDILISRDGVWHLRGLPVHPHSALETVDIAFNALHGHYGEDGKVQHIIKQYSVPYTGSHTFASALTMHKPRTSVLLANIPNLKLPASVILSPDGVYDLEAEAKKVFAEFPPPYIVKPVANGSSIGLHLVKTIRDLPRIIEQAFQMGDIIVEEMIVGKEVSCAIIEDFRDEEHYALPPVEIIPETSTGFFDKEAKISTQKKLICPALLTTQEKEHIQEKAREIHKTLGLRHYSQSDFILHPTRGLFYLETNTLPGLTQYSLLPHALESVGSNLKEFLNHIIGLALNKK